MKLSFGILALCATGMPLIMGFEAPVTVEYWTSPRFDWDADSGEEGPNVEGIALIRAMELGFTHEINFELENYIHEGDGVCVDVDRDGTPLDLEGKDEVCESSCIDERRYCEAPPTDENHSKVTGSMIVHESLIRQCIWELYHSGNNNHNWGREKKMILYMEHSFARKCHEKGYPILCTKSLYMESKIDPHEVKDCISKSEGDDGNTLLEGQIEKQIERGIDQLPSLPALLVNGEPIAEMSEEAAFRAVCKALPDASSVAVCQGKLSEVLGENEDSTEEAEAKKELVAVIAEELGETTEEVEEDLEGLSQEEQFEDEIEEEEAEEEEFGETTAEAEEAEEEEEHEEEEELGLEAFEALDEAGFPILGNSSVPTEEESGASETEGEGMPTFEFPSETAAAPEGEGEPNFNEFQNSETPVATEAPELGGEGEPAFNDFHNGEAPATPEGQEEETSFEFPSETSSSHLDSVNSMGEESKQTLPQHESEATEEPVAPKETPVAPAPGEAGEAAELDSLDLALVHTATDHLEALANCEVDTTLLLDKLMALGSSGGNLKTEAEDIESDIPMLMTQTCPHEEGEEILHRLQSFHGCAMFDLQELIETFPSTAVGVAVRCANAYSNMTKEEEESGFIPEACVRTVEASSVLGRGIFGLYLYPDVACPCFEKLGDEIPECTADVWPIPINGALLKTQSCLVGQYCQTIDGLCEDKMTVLNDCLPARRTKPNAMDCDDIFDKCSAVYEDIHPMLNAAPLPDACVRIAQGSNFYGTHLVERYDAFRHQCGKNIELWEGHSKVSEFKSFVQEGLHGIDYESVPFVTGVFGGFLAGVIVTLVVIIVRNVCICIRNLISRCCNRCCGRGKRPKAKDYATIQTNGDEIEEYHDEE